MKRVKVTIVKNVVMKKTDYIEVSDDMTDEVVINKACDVIYHNGEEWLQTKVNSIGFEIDEEK
jgi:hypothetical protein